MSSATMTNVSELHPYPQKVFISFRGKEMRHGLLSFLKDEFEKNKINYIMDDNELRGNFITIVFKRIEESSAALVFITPTFSESSWCLNELVVMKKQMEAGDLVIIPIFYGKGAGAETVKNQKGWFGNRLLKTENYARMNMSQRSKKAIVDTEIMIWEWRQALKCVGGIMGIHYEHKSDKDFVTDIVVHLKQRLEAMPPRTDHMITANPLVVPSQEEIGGLTTFLEALKLKNSDIKDHIHSNPSKNDIERNTDDFLFLDLSSIDKPVLVQQLMEQGQAGKIVLVLLGSLEDSNEGFDFKPVVLPKNPQQLGFLGRSSEKSGSRTDGKTYFTMLSCILELFATRRNSSSVFISFGEKKLRKTLVSSIKRELELSKISWVEKESFDESRVAVVVFSSGYPDSEKCLDELVEIKKRTDKGDLDAFPVFYDLEHHETVKELSGHFLNRLLKIEHKVRETVDIRNENSILETDDRITKWRQALSSISSRSELSNKNHTDPEFISDVLTNVKKLLYKKRYKPLMPQQETVFYTLNSFLKALNYERSDLECFTEKPNGVVSLTLKDHVYLMFLKLTCHNIQFLSQRIAELKRFKEMITGNGLNGEN